MSGDIYRVGREPLPARRANETVAKIWIDALGVEREIEISAGYYPDGRIGEAFARAGRPDSTLDAMLDEGCQLISRLLQRGCPLAEIVKGMAFDARGRAETPLGLVARTLIALEAE